MEKFLELAGIRELVHTRAVFRAVDAPVDARTGRRALTYVDDPLDLAS